MEMKKVYRYMNSEDGLFDVELNDVSDIDSLADYSVLNTIVKAWDSANQVADISSVGKGNNKEKGRAGTPKNSMPTLEMIIGNDLTPVFKFMELVSLRYILSK